MLLAIVASLSVGNHGRYFIRRRDCGGRTGVCHVSLFLSGKTSATVAAGADNRWRAVFEPLRSSFVWSLWQIIAIGHRVCWRV